MKKPILIGLAVVASSLMAYQTEVVDGIEWKYEDYGDVVRLYGYFRASSDFQHPDTYVTCIPQDTSGDVVVPEILGGKTVAGIKSYAFYRCSKITSIKMRLRV